MSKVKGTKIAQAAKDLNVTSVTIRRYISEFNIETATDQNGIKVLPETAMEELKEVRRLKEEGLTNPKVLEHIEEQRTKGAKGPKKSKAKEETEEKEVAEEKADKKPSRSRSKSKSESTATRRKSRSKVEEEEEEQAEEEQEEEVPAAPRRGARRKSARSTEEEQSEDEEDSEDSEDSEGEGGDAGQGEGRLKHSLTCQTCGKTFEHLNPRLRDCLDCYRSKRKERRRGGDRHKNVIQHPLAQQVVSKMASQQQQKTSAPAEPQAAPVREIARPQPAAHAVGVTQPIIGGLKTKVRSYRKAIEETRQITGSLKRRLERPDLPEGDRRWLEQIYAYQLILHQGWRHLSEYRSTTNQQSKSDD